MTGDNKEHLFIPIADPKWLLVSGTNDDNDEILLLTEQHTIEIIIRAAIKTSIVTMCIWSYLISGNGM